MADYAKRNVILSSSFCNKGLETSTKIEAFCSALLSVRLPVASSISGRKLCLSNLVLGFRTNICGNFIRKISVHYRIFIKTKR